MALIIRNIGIQLLLISILLCMAGCIKEDNSNCPRRGFYVCFIPENPKHDYPLLAQRVDLYFYDEAGTLQVELHCDKESLREGDGAVFVDCKLPDGQYTLVSLINDLESYRTVNTQSLESLQSFLVKLTSSDRLVDFFSGISEVRLVGDVQDDISANIFKHNNNIHLELILEDYDVPVGSNFSSNIKGNNGVYDHLSGTCPGEGGFRTYLPYFTTKNQKGLETSFDFSVLRLWRDSDLVLYLSEMDESENVAQTISVNLADQLAKVRNDQGIFLYDSDKKLSFHDDFKIVIKLRADLTVIDLTINGWFVIRGGIDV